MTNEIPPIEEELADDIVEIVEYQASMPSPSKVFLPWHRPRKQFVRAHQWCHEIKKMISQARPTEGILKYLGLPGVDLLDLRHIHTSICDVQEIGLRFLGFNSSAHPKSAGQIELNLSLAEVRSLPRVDPMSDVIGDNFARIANQDSIAFLTALKLGPYDVINLDLCDGFGAQAPSKLDNNYYEAVSSLFALQSKSMNPWLLLLTTRADKANVDDEVLEMLLKKYTDNLNVNESFRHESLANFSIESEEALRAAAETAGGLLPIFLTGLCKWFLGFGLALQPPIKMVLCSAVGYRVIKEAINEDLISLAIKFTPTFVPPRDPLGLAPRTLEMPDEGVLAVKALKKVASRIDADKILRENPELNETMTVDTMSLLGLARYDTSTYRTWLGTPLD